MDWLRRAAWPPQFAPPLEAPRSPCGPVVWPDDGKLTGAYWAGARATQGTSINEDS